MRRYGMVMAVGLLVLVNVVVLGGVASNRRGEPDATVTLTERELPLSSYYGYADRENTGLSLQLNWSRGRTGYVKGAFKVQRHERQTEWFDKAKLEAIGFDCTMPPDAPRAELHYQKLLPRKTYAVLEFEGEAWEAGQADEQAELARMEGKIATGEVSRKQLREAREEYQREARTRSRLFAVDVGNDPISLRTQYADRSRFLILAATVRLYYHRPDDDGGEKKSPPRLEGSIDDILTDEIYVPKEHRAVLERLLRTDRQMRSGDYSPYAQRQRGPSYEVKLYAGKRCEPWVAGVSPLVPETVK